VSTPTQCHDTLRDRDCLLPFLPPRGKEMRLSVVPGTMDVVIKFLFFGPVSRHVMHYNTFVCIIERV
jgi:hypothetical protein